MDCLLGSKSLPPGIRFHPTDEELFMFYLKRKVLGKSLGPEMMSEVDVYQFAPWELPAKACLKNRDLYWFFLCPRLKKYPTGGRSNRATVYGYWKSTGNDRTVDYKDRPVGKIKTLVFHRGKAPKGDRTDWVMHEYRLEDRVLKEQGVAQDSYVICKIYEKSGMGPKNGEHYGAPFVEEEWDNCNEDNLETGCGPVLHPGTVNAQTRQLVSSGVAQSEQGSVVISASDPLDSAMPSTDHQPEASVVLTLPPIENEEDELDRLLAMFADVNDVSANQDAESDIFKGLEESGNENPIYDPDLDWSRYLNDDCYMELKDLEG